MARDAQAVTVGVDAGQSEFVSFERGGFGLAPVGRQVWRGSFTLDGSGATDTADCRITLPLPTRLAYQLEGFFISIEGTAGYDEGLFEWYYSPSGVTFGQSTQLNFPLAPTALVDPADTLSEMAGFVIAHQTRDLSSVFRGPVDVHAQSPFNFITYTDPSFGSNPVIWIGSGNNTNIPSATCRFAVTALAFNLEQMREPEINVGLRSR